MVSAWKLQGNIALLYASLMPAAVSESPVEGMPQSQAGLQLQVRAVASMLFASHRCQARRHSSLQGTCNLLCKQPNPCCCWSSDSAVFTFSQGRTNRALTKDYCVHDGVCVRGGEWVRLWIGEASEWVS